MSLFEGSNCDPLAGPEGCFPYELADRKENYEPVVTFDDTEQWILEYCGVKASLYRSNEQKIWRDYCSKLTFEATENDAEMFLKLKIPVDLPEPWDCLAMWVYGHRWSWTDQKTEPLELEFVLEDADKKEHRVRYQGYFKGAINHKDWFFLRVKVHKEIPRPCKLIGIRLWGEKVTLENEQKKIYLGPFYAYKEQLKPLKFEPWPEQLPFPLKGKTILPTNRCKSFKNIVTENDENYELTYNGSDASFTYHIKPQPGTLGDIKVTSQDKVVFPCKSSSIDLCLTDDVEWKLQQNILSDNQLMTTWQVTAGTVAKTIYINYSIKQKSLIIDLEESDNGPGIVESISLGAAEFDSKPKLIQIPFLNFDYAKAPRAVYHDGLFLFSIFDWYTSQASTLYEGEIGIKENKAVYNGGVKYIQKTDGQRNCVKDRLYINISHDFQEVLPDIPNPPSPMKDMMGHRCWLVMNCLDYNCRWVTPKKYRALGMEHVAVRYHEGAWRDIGESFTFKTTAAPKQGGDAALKKLVSDVKSLGWLCGLYTSYTDLVTLSPYWDEDWLLHDANGDWVPSWFRGYSPKPMVGVEQQKNFAPIIHEKFGTNHSYCDVHTAIPIFARVDYDYRVPGAGTFQRTYKCYGRILLGEREAHKGPVFSEGANHWWYAGLVDGNYANAFPLLNEQAPLVDFDLLKIHPLQMDALTNNMPLDEQVAYGLAYAHIGQLIPHDAAGSMKIYYMLQPLERYYTLVPTKNILYHDGKKYVTTSEALANGGIEKKRVHVVFENDFKYWVNLGSDNWAIKTEKGQFLLPPTGFVAFSNDKKAMAVSVLVDIEGQEEKVRVDYSYGPESYYFDSRDSNVTYGIFEGKGAAALKKEESGWELIPALDFSKLSFPLDAIGFDHDNISVICLNEDGNELIPASFRYRITK